MGNEHKVSIGRSGRANVPPILNVVEIYRVQEFSDSATLSRDDMFFCSQFYASKLYFHNLVVIKNFMQGIWAV